jgi:hypothetical protein
VEDSEVSSLALDGIFADCYSRWGGRFSLIAPCVDGKISAAYWPWLEAFDPDIVYSYVALARADILEIYERLSPSQYKYHPVRAGMRRDVFGFKPSYDFAPLSSLSTIFRQARYSQSESGPALRIIDCWASDAPSQLLSDNFGTYYTSQGGSLFPLDARSAAGLLTIVSPEHQKNPQLGIPRDLAVIPDDTAAFVEFAAKRATSLSISSALFSPRLNVHSDRWSGAFCLTIGNSFSDRVMFWNSRLLIPSWLDTDICCMRANMDDLKKPDLLAAIGNVLKHRNLVNRGQGGQSIAIIRSTSLTVGELVAARELILSTKPWGVITSETVDSLDELVPSDRALNESRDVNHYEGSFFRRSSWAQFSWSPPVAKPLTKIPDHLADAPPRQFFTQGYWSADFIFECEGPGPRMHAANRWMLPKRWRMARCFKTVLAGDAGPGTISPSPRRSRNGNLSVFTCVDHPIDTISIPSAFDALVHALAVDGHWSKSEAEHSDVYPACKLTWMRRSNEARYLNGIIGMAGGISYASQLFLHPFLVDLFAGLGGTPNLPPDKISPTVNRLKKIARTRPSFDIRDDNERSALAAMIVKAAQTLKRPSDHLRYADVKLAWEGHRKAYWAANPQNTEPADSGDYDLHEAETLGDCFVFMRERQMMFQGHRWTCPKCHHRNWIDLAALASELSCQVCKTSRQAPIDIEWLFRPNEFLIESLRDHSVLSLIWFITALSRRARSSFTFVEPSSLGFSEAENPDAEIDLFALVDGVAIAAEVKSSWSTLRRSDIDDLVSNAIRIRPDKAILAIMEAGTNFDREIADARSRLSVEKIDFELLTLDRFGLEDSPMLSVLDYV